MSPKFICVQLGLIRFFGDRCHYLSPSEALNCKTYRLRCVWFKLDWSSCVRVLADTMSRKREFYAFFHGQASELPTISRVNSRRLHRPRRYLLRLTRFGENHVKTTSARKPRAFDTQDAPTECSNAPARNCFLASADATKLSYPRLFLIFFLHT